MSEMREGGRFVAFAVFTLGLFGASSQVRADAIFIFVQHADLGRTISAPSLEPTPYLTSR